jgi:hypothetical protein
MYWGECQAVPNGLQTNINPAQAFLNVSVTHSFMYTIHGDGMAPSEPLTQAVSIHDIVGMSDTELDLFLEKNRRPEGGFELDVDWTILSKDQRDLLAQRLR